MEPEFKINSHVKYNLYFDKTPPMKVLRVYQMDNVYYYKVRGTDKLIPENELLECVEIDENGLSLGDDIYRLSIENMSSFDITKHKIINFYLGGSNKTSVSIGESGKNLEDGNTFYTTEIDSSAFSVHLFGYFSRQMYHFSSKEKLDTFMLLFKERVKALVIKIIKKHDINIEIK